MLEESSWYCEYSSFDYRLTKIKNVNRNIRIELKSGYAKIKALDNQGLLDSLKLNEITLWRRRESNPRPETLILQLLRV